MYENKSVKKMTNKAEIIIKKLYIYLIKNNKKFILPDLKKNGDLKDQFPILLLAWQINLLLICTIK